VNAGNGYVSGRDITGDYTEKQLTEEFDLIKEIMEKQGYDRLPRVVSQTELESYISANRTPDLYRGFYSGPRGVSVRKVNQEFLCGDVYISDSGGSTEGRGIYTTNSKRVAMAYARHGGTANTESFLARMTVDKAAKILRTSELKASEVLAYKFGTTRCTLSNRIAAKGYDALEIPFADFGSYYLILNRSAIITDGLNYLQGGNRHG
jgi:hypothetical protein